MPDVPQPTRNRMPNDPEVIGELLEAPSPECARAPRLSPPMRLFRTHRPSAVRCWGSLQHGLLLPASRRRTVSCSSPSLSGSGGSGPRAAIVWRGARHHRHGRSVWLAPASSEDRDCHRGPGEFLALRRAPKPWQFMAAGTGSRPCAMLVASGPRSPVLGRSGHAWLPDLGPAPGVHPHVVSVLMDEAVLLGPKMHEAPSLHRPEHAQQTESGRISSLCGAGQ